VPRCPVCGADLVPDARYCEGCGHDITRPPPAAPPRWSLVVTADRAWFDEVCRREGPDVASIAFPGERPARTYPLVAPRMTIGRHSHSRGVTPEIDLGAPPPDPGVSARHAVLLARPDGGWDLVDVGSTNGTVLGDAPEPIEPETPVPLAAGDRIKLGAWTVLTVVADAGQSR